MHHFLQDNECRVTNKNQNSAHVHIGNYHDRKMH